MKPEEGVKNQPFVTSLIQVDTKQTEVSTSGSSKFFFNYFLLHNVSVIIFQNNRHNMKIIKDFLIS